MSITTDSAAAEPPLRSRGLSYKAWLVVAVAAFAIGILSGLAAPVNLAALLEQDLRALQELGSTLSPFHITTALFIYLKNASVLLFSFALGPLFLLFAYLELALKRWVLGKLLRDKSSAYRLATAVFIYPVLLFSFALGPLFLLFPLLVLVVNGWVIAVVSVEVVKQASLAYLLTGILPHGVVEIPALLLGEAAAFSFGSTLILAFFRRENRAQLRPAVRRSLRYLLVALILFLPAAVIETYLTPWLLG